MANSLSAIDAPSPEDAKRILRTGELIKGTNRAYFERVVTLMGADPEAARELASRWRLFAKYGDYEAYALRARAVGERLKGNWTASANIFLESGKRADNELDAAVFSTGAVDSLARAGEVDRAVVAGERLVRKLDSLGETGLAGRVRLNVGNALLHKDAYRRAAIQFEKAARDLKDSGFEAEAAAAHLGISGSMLLCGNVAQSMDTASQAVEAFDRLGNKHYGALARLNLAHGLLLQGRGDEALDLLLRIAPTLSGSAADTVRCEEFLGDAFLRLNLFEAARDAYMSALSQPALRAMPLNHANCIFGCGLADFALGNAGVARRSLSRAARCYRKLGNSAWAGAALSAASECMPSSLARRASSDAIELLRSSKSRYHLAVALLRHAERFGDEGALLNAAKLISTNGYGFMRWRIFAARAMARSGKDRLHNWRKMFESLMADRLQTRSISSRLGFLRDKSLPLSQYLGDLLNRPVPLVDEAVSVVSQSRSVALIDELLAAQQGVLSETAKATLEELRIVVAEETSLGPGLGTRRRCGASALPRLQRKWLQTAFAQALLANDASPHPPTEGVATYVVTDRGYFVLFGGRAIRIEASEPELAKMLQWFEFDLLSPTVGDFDLSAVNRRVSNLREILTAPLYEIGSPIGVVPDGELWSAPWNLMFDRETPILSNPTFALPESDPPPKSVVVWAHDPGDLPNVASEVTAIRDLYPHATVVQDIRSARETLEQPIDLLHVAGHAIANAENPMFSALELEGGLLLATEIAKSRASIGQVTLSACDTGRVSVIVRSEPDGLVRSFLATGANLVVASQWQLDDNAASVTMRTYYSELAAGCGPMLALATARNVCRKRYGHPYFWGGLTIYGGYRR